MPDSKSNKPAVTKKVAPKKTAVKKIVAKKTVAKKATPKKSWVTQTKAELFNKSDTFCVLPWIHLHTTPTGQAAPCCIS